MIRRSPRIPRGILMVGVVLGTMWATVGRGQSVEYPPGERLTAAKRYVETSEKYLHHAHLRRVMKVYGLTVLSGT